MKNGERETENGKMKKWKMENDEWRMENGKRK